MKDNWKSIERNRICVYSRGVSLPFMRAALNIVTAARTGLSLVYGLTTPGRLEIVLRRIPAGRMALWTNGSDSIFLNVTCRRDLGPPRHGRGGAHHVYGLCHELAHIAMYRRIRNVLSLPPGWGEGWAHCVASISLIPFVWNRLGSRAWPDPYPYLKTEGPDRFAIQVKRGMAAASPSLTIARKLSEIHSSLGPKAVGAALLRCEAARVTGDKFEARFRKELGLSRRKW